MAIDVRPLLRHYALVIAVGGGALLAAVLVTDLRWLDMPAAVAGLTATVFALRAAPVRLSKYSYLTQTGVPALVGVVAVGAPATALALYVGTLAADILWLRKPAAAGFINAGREVIALIVAAGAYAAVLRLSGDPGLSLDALPALATLICLYFYASRTLFYFTLLLRAKLASEERLLILRWEIVSYLLTLVTSGVILAALATLAPAGWIAVIIVLGVLGLLTKRIVEEAIAAEDLNKVHQMESLIASNISLTDSFQQIERLAYRLLDWGDLRIYRLDNGTATLVYRGTLGRSGRSEPPPSLAGLRDEVLARGEALVVTETAQDSRTAALGLAAGSLIIHPLRLGDRVIGCIELEHHRRHAYRNNDLAALSTVAAQVATAIHIADLRRPLVSTVEQIGLQVQALARAAESLRNTGGALITALRAIRSTAAEQELFVS
ncbi:MAG: GAF domain-containing protein, partial [Gemmatimonadota bacterium]